MKCETLQKADKIIKIESLQYLLPYNEEINETGTMEFSFTHI